MLGALAACSAPPRTAEPAQGSRDVTEDAVTTTRVDYGDHEDQYLTVHRPAGTPLAPTVVLIHGGFWRERYRADLMTPLAEDLAARGHVAVNAEYRRVGGSGGWPQTFEDVAAALDRVAALDVPQEVVTVGHSAGGHLAFWAAARHRLPVGAPGADPLVRPCGAVSQAGAADLGLAAELGLGGAAVAELLGGAPGQVADRYDLADPVRLLPLGVPVLLVHGERDRLVPIEVSRSYLAAAEEAGDDAELVTLPGDHFAPIDPADALWEAVAARLDGLCG